MARTFIQGKTRKQVANELLVRLKRGPQISMIGRSGMTAEEFSREYRCWAESWILTEVCNLVPELKENLDVFGYFATTVPVDGKPATQGYIDPEATA